MLKSPFSPFELLAAYPYSLDDTLFVGRESAFEVSRARMIPARLNSLILLIPLPVNTSSSRRSSGVSMIAFLVLVIGITHLKK
jgi:hypothetical protein